MTFCRFPCLISECTVDWFLPWPKDALLSVAQKYVSEFSTITNQNVKVLLGQMMAGTHDIIEAVAQQYFHKFRRHIYITPKSYLSFINSFKQIFLKTHVEINNQITKLSQGLEKLRQAAEDVQGMKEVLAVKEAQLDQAQKLSSDLLASITQSTAKAEKKKAEITAIKNQLAEHAEIVGRDHETATKEVAEFKPELEKAMAQVKLIRSSDITTMRNLRNPPDLIKRIGDAIIVVKSFGPLEPVQMVEVQGRLQMKDSWSTSQLMMVNSSFLPSLLNFESDNINEETLELLQPYLDMPDFTHEDAKRSSNSVASLLGWVKAQHFYKKVTKNLAPKLLALQDAEARLNVAKVKLQTVMDELAAQQAELNKMKKEFDTALQEKQKVQEEAEYTRSRMEAADSLITSLGSEKIRWSQQSNEINETLQQAIGNAAVASGFISYVQFFPNFPLLS